jgi:hypothetical protein
MNHPRTRMMAIVAAAAVGLAATLGCGVISAARNVVGNLQTLSDMADKMGRSEQTVFQADYRLADGSTVTVAQQPPASADTGATGRFISTPEAMYLCDKDGGGWVCQKSPAAEGTDGSEASVAATVLGQGFVSAPLALGVLTAALLVPTAKVAKSTPRIAGQRSTCAKVSGLESAQQQTDPSASPEPKISDFTVCITDAGVLSRFSGRLTDGTRAAIEMTRYSTRVDASLFQPPAGARINDVTQLTGTPQPSAS